MYRLSFSVLLAVVALIGVSSSSQAQIYVPHTTTHYDLVPHRGHFDSVPHTTTHYHAIPNPNYGYNQSFGYGQTYVPNYSSHYSNRSFGYSSYYGGNSIVVPHQSTHLDVVPHRGHYHVVPHTTTHYHRY